MESFDRVFVLGSGSGFTTVGPREEKQMQQVCYKRWNVQLMQKLNCKCQLLRLVGRGGTAGEECGESKTKIQPSMTRGGNRSAPAAT